jgi:hypothetical protein
MAEGAFASVRDGFNISYFDDIDRRIVHLRKVFIGILRDIDPSRNVKIQLTDADKRIMCGVHVPLVMAGTTNIAPVGEDMAQAATFPALTFGKDVDVVVSPRAEHCKFVLDWIKDQGLVDSVAVFTTKMANGEDAFDEILNINANTNKDYFVAHMDFVRCEDVVSGKVIVKPSTKTWRYSGYSLRGSRSASTTPTQATASARSKSDSTVKVLLWVGGGIVVLLVLVGLFMYFNPRNK